MKGTNTCRLFTSTVILVTVASVGAAEPKGSANVLSETMFIQMDADGDGKISQLEYVDFGTAYLKKKGKRANPSQMLQQFDGFDRDGDGLITAADPTFRSPSEILEERISGMWTCEKTKNGSIAFVFMEDGHADVIQKGESIREQMGDVVRYRFIHPKNTPTCLDVIVDQGEGTYFYFKCIIEFTPEDQMKMRMATGGEYIPRPKNFPAAGGGDTITLVKTALPEKTPDTDALADNDPDVQKEQTKDENIAKPADGVHRGTLSATAKIARDSDKRVKREEKQIPAGLVITTTTEKSKDEIQSLNISVSNGGPKQDTFQLCWYFLCHPHDGKTVRVYDKGTKDITLDPKKRVSQSVTAKKIGVVEETMERENEDTGLCQDPVTATRGDEVEGYVLLLKHNGVILDKKSHDKDFLTDLWLSKL